MKCLSLGSISDKLSPASLLHNISPLTFNYTYPKHIKPISLNSLLLICKFLLLKTHESVWGKKISLGFNYVHSGSCGSQSDTSLFTSSMSQHLTKCLSSLFWQSHLPCRVDEERKDQIKLGKKPFQKINDNPQTCHLDRFGWYALNIKPDLHSCHSETKHLLPGNCLVKNFSHQFHLKSCTVIHKSHGGSVHIRICY